MYQQIKKGALALSLSLCCVGAFAQKTITGNVKDATGEPLIGVTIQAGKGGTVTDIDGNFSLQNLKPGDKITISYLGCKTQTITVGNQSALNIVMQSTDKSLDEVVVIGYGTMKRRDLTGAVASVTGDKLAQNPVSNIAEALQGQLPGVSVTSQDGRPGGSMSIRVRGGGVPSPRATTLSSSSTVCRYHVLMISLQITSRALTCSRMPPLQPSMVRVVPMASS